MNEDRADCSAETSWEAVALGKIPPLARYIADRMTQRRSSRKRGTDSFASAKPCNSGMISKRFSRRHRSIRMIGVGAIGGGRRAPAIGLDRYFAPARRHA